MTEFVAPITRRNYGNGHGYRDANGQKVPGVTTILKAYPKQLTGWAQRTVAACVIDEWDEICDMRPSTRYAYLSRAADRDRNKAGIRGTKLHALAARIAEGEEVTVDDDTRDLVDSYLKFLREFRVGVYLTEFCVVSHEHGYAGTGDLVADVWDEKLRRHVRWLLDIKTARSGVFGDNALQLAAYRYAEYRIAEEDDGYVPMNPLGIERTGVLHVRQDDYDLVPVKAGPAEFRHFLYVKQTWHFMETDREGIGEPVEPPPPLPTLPDETGDTE